MPLGRNPSAIQAQSLPPSTGPGSLSSFLSHVQQKGSVGAEPSGEAVKEEGEVKAVCADDTAIAGE